MGAELVLGALVALFVFQFRATLAVRRERDYLQGEIDRLAAAILDVPGEPAGPGGAVDTAIRLIAGGGATPEFVCTACGGAWREDQVGYREISEEGHAPGTVGVATCPTCGGECNWGAA